MGAYSSHVKNPTSTQLHLWDWTPSCESEQAKQRLVGWWVNQSMEVWELQWIPGMFTLPKFNMGVSKNRGTPKSWILIGFSILNHPSWNTTIFVNTHIEPEKDAFQVRNR